MTDIPEPWRPPQVPWCKYALLLGPPGSEPLLKIEIRYTQGIPRRNRACFSQGLGAVLPSV